MKRFLLYISCFIFVFLVGCKSKSGSTKMLECNSTNSVGSTTSEQNYKIYFDSDKVEKLSIGIDVSLSEQDDVTRDNLESDVSKAFESYKNRPGISYSSNVKDNGFSVKLDINFDKLSEEDKANISLINSEKSFDDIKVELEGNGFSCK